MHSASGRIKIAVVVTAYEAGLHSILCLGQTTLWASSVSFRAKSVILPY